MSDEILLVEEDARGIATLTLNRPDARNALDDALIDKFATALAIINKKPEIRIVVITGAEHCFTSGVDITWMEHLVEGGPSEDARRLAHMLLTVKNLSKPTIALVDGACIGGGAALVASCDIAIATEEAYFALPAVHIGAVSAVVTPFVSKAIGPRMTKRYLVTGERFGPEKAKEIQLVHAVCMRAQLQETAEGFIDHLLRGAPGALAAAKEMFNDFDGRPLNKSLVEDAARLTARLRKTPEAREGLAAFIEKRAPNWIKQKD